MLSKMKTAAAWLVSPHFHKIEKPNPFPIGTGSSLKSALDGIRQRREAAEASHSTAELHRLDNEARFDWWVKHEDLREGDLARIQNRLAAAAWVNIVWAALIASAIAWVASNGVPSLMPAVMENRMVQAVYALAAGLFFVLAILVAAGYSWNAAQVRRRSLFPFIEWYSSPALWIPRFAGAGTSRGGEE